jgi:hypothetical protein
VPEIREQLSIQYSGFRSGARGLVHICNVSHRQFSFSGGGWAVGMNMESGS